MLPKPSVRVSTSLWAILTATEHAAARMDLVTNMPRPTTSDTGKSEVATSRVELFDCSHEMPDLAPKIIRRRLVIEGTCQWPIVEDQIKRYLARLSDVCGMRLLAEPVTHQSERYGWAGWVHWESSGRPFLRLGHAQPVLQCGHLHVQGIRCRACVRVHKGILSGSPGCGDDLLGSGRLGTPKTGSRGFGARCG